MSHYRQGREAGQTSGWNEGYFYGQCESLIGRIQFNAAVRPIHVLYVMSGKGFPYSPIDEAIAETLRRMVGQLTITDTTQPVAALATRIRPDIVLVLDGLQFNVAQVDEIRAAGIRTAIWFTDDPYYTDFTAAIAPHYDDIFTLELTCLDFYRGLGCSRVHYMPLGVYTADFRPRNQGRRNRHDISFIGSGYWPRISFFNQITGYLAGKNTLISGLWWERLKDFHLIRNKIALGKWMGPRATSDMYNGSKIVINMHRAHNDQTFNNNSAGIPAVSPNPRTFEISACATLQLTDIRDDLARFYTPGVEIVTYSSPQEMMEKIDHYLNHEQERREIAIHGMYRTMREHTYVHRLDAMLSILFPDQKS